MWNVLVTTALACSLRARGVRTGRRGVRPRSRLAGPAGRAQGRGHEVLVDQHDLSRHRPRLLGLRAEAVRPRQAGRVMVFQDGAAYIKEDGNCARPHRLRQPHPQGRDAGHGRHLHQPGRGAGPVRERAAPVQPQLRVRRPGRPLCALPARGDPARGGEDGEARAGRQQPRDRRGQLGGDLRLHRRVGAARRLQPRVQHHRHLRRPARRSRLLDPRPQDRAQADARLPAGRLERPQHLRRRLVDGQPGDAPVAGVRRLRREPRVGRRGPQRQARRRDPARRLALALARLPGAHSPRGGVEAAAHDDDPPARGGLARGRRHPRVGARARGGRQGRGGLHHRVGSRPTRRRRPGRGRPRQGPGSRGRGFRSGGEDLRGRCARAGAWCPTTPVAARPSWPTASTPTASP